MRVQSQVLDQQGEAFNHPINHDSTGFRPVLL